MVVRLDAGRDAVRAYVAEQAALGKEHVIALVKGEAEALLSHIGDLTEAQGCAIPRPDAFSALQVLQHLNASFERSMDRLRTLSSDQPWSASGGPAGPGAIPADAVTSFVESRRLFEESTAGVLEVLRRADGSKGLGRTAPHAGYGEFNWLQWAVYSHHVHTHDHVGQMAEIRAAVRQ
jgi:hypothetical protein